VTNTLTGQRQLVTQIKLHYRECRQIGCDSQAADTRKHITALYQDTDAVERRDLHALI